MNNKDLSSSQLFTKDFFLVSAGNFFLFLSFYTLMPLLPFFLYEKYATDDSMIGLILSSYMIACILIRPIAGYLLDAFKRRPIYLISYIGFAFAFCGYIVAGTIAIFTLIRIIHGAFFGSATVSGSTILTQIIPKSRLGEGLGIYGLANTLAMCIGPVIGLFAYHHIRFNLIFLFISVAAFIGVLMVSNVKIPYRPKVERHRISIKNFIIPSGLWVALSQLLVFVPYGATVTYISVYAKEIGIENYAGLYFTMMAIGLAASRPLAGKKVDKGMVRMLTILGLCLSVITFLSLSYIGLSTGVYRTIGFLVIAFMQGVTYGILFPSFNTIFVRLAPDERRGAATSMFMTSNDLGIGLGMLIGGIVAQYTGGFHNVYLIGSILGFISILIFIGTSRKC